MPDSIRDPREDYLDDEDEGDGYSTDGPTPPPCDQEVYNNGTQVFVGGSISSNRMEIWVKKVEEKSGQRVDWFYFGGRAVVLALGDIKKVLETIQELEPEYDELSREYLNDLSGKSEKIPETGGPEWL